MQGEADSLSRFHPVLFCEIPASCGAVILAVSFLFAKGAKGQKPKKSLFFILFWERKYKLFTIKFVAPP
jgi:hypothetical protein